MQVHYFYEYGDNNSNMTSHQRHKQLPGLVYEVKASFYASTVCNGKDSFTGEEVQHDPDHAATLFCFREFSLVLPIILPPTALHFFMLDTVGSHLNIADRSICD